MSVKRQSVGEARSQAAHDCAVAAVDIGTTGIKAAVVSFTGQVLTVAERRQVIVGDGPGWREHVPARMLRSTIAALSEVVAEHGRPEAICSIAITGSSGSFMMLDDAARPITNILTWQDRRAYSAPVTPGLDPRHYAQVTGTSLGPSVCLSRMLWLREHRPDVMHPSGQLATPQGFVMMACGASGPSIDPSVAAFVGLLDLETRDWSPELLDVFRIDSTTLPHVVPSGSVVGHLGPSLARRLGLRAGIDLVLAATDGVCAQLGAGVVEDGQVYGYLGSASAVSGPTRQAMRDPEGHLNTAPGFGPGWWRLGGLGMAGASAIDWLTRATGRSVLRDLEGTLEKTDPGAGGVLFLPSLAGAGAPLWDAGARGAFLGLTFSTRRPEIVRAVVEGVALEMRAMFEAIRRAGIDAVGMRLTGGGSRSRGWCRVVADAVHGEVSRVTETHPGLRGAAFYAMAAHADWQAVEAVAAARLPDIEVIDGDLHARRVYDDLAQSYIRAQRAISRSSVDRRLARMAVGVGPCP